MLFINFASLVDGKLLNEPSIASFENIVYDVKKVSTGDLFIGKKSDIKEAIKNGAYGIASSSLVVKDEEIAWIEVDSIKKIKQKLLRYYIVQSGLQVLLLSEEECAMLELLTNKTSLLSLHGDNQEIFKKLNHSSCLKLIITRDKKLLDDIGIEPFEPETKVAIDVVKHTVFLTTFRYKENFYKDVKFPTLFLDNLTYILSSLDTLDIEYNIYNLNFIDAFKPIFLDSYFKIKPFGQSTKVIICINNKKIFKLALKYIQKNASWANISKITPDGMNGDYNYNKYHDIYKIDISSFNYILLYDEDAKFEEYLIKKESMSQKSLF